MCWKFIFDNPGEANLNLVREFYANWNVDDIEDLVPVRGRLIDISQGALRRFLGPPDVPVESLIEFATRPHY